MTHRTEVVPLRRIEKIIKMEANVARLKKKKGRLFDDQGGKRPGSS
jgi:hypothetical protein